MKGWFNDGAFDKSAVLAYCAVFSIAPLLVLVTFFVALFHKGDTIEIVRIQFADFISPAVAEVIAKGVVNAGFAPGKNILYTSFAGLMVIVGASAFTYELRELSMRCGSWSRRKENENFCFGVFGRCCSAWACGIGSTTFFHSSSSRSFIG